MINHETELKLQAYLDGELPTGEAKAVADLLGRDAGAQALYQELRITQSLLAGNELERKLPESREFYWSKIQRQIERVESTQADALTEPSTPRWWTRFLAPVGVLAALAVFVAVVLRSPDGGATFLSLNHSHDIATPPEETSSFSFRSEAAAMT